MGKKKRKSQPHNKRLDSLSLPRNQKSKREEIARMIYNHAVQSFRSSDLESNAYKGGDHPQTPSAGKFSGKKQPAQA